jgi:hypothetical protein
LWLENHGLELAMLFHDVRAIDLSPSRFIEEVVVSVMAMTTPPPGGRDTAVLIALIMRVFTAAMSPPSLIDPSQAGRGRP